MTTTWISENLRQFTIFSIIDFHHLHWSQLVSLCFFRHRSPKKINDLCNLQNQRLQPKKNKSIPHSTIKTQREHQIVILCSIRTASLDLELQRTYALIKIRKGRARIYALQKQESSKSKTKKEPHLLQNLTLSKIIQKERKKMRKVEKDIKQNQKIRTSRKYKHNVQSRNICPIMTGEQYSFVSLKYLREKKREKPLVLYNNYV